MVGTQGESDSENKTNTGLEAGTQFQQSRNNPDLAAETRIRVASRCSFTDVVLHSIHSSTSYLNFCFSFIYF